MRQLNKQSRLNSKNGTTGLRQWSQWRLWLTLSRFVTISVSFVVVISLMVAAWYAYKTLMTNKLRDVWAIQYLELESLVKDLRFESFATVSPKKIYTIGKINLASKSSPKISMSSLDIDRNILNTYRSYDQILLQAEGIIYSGNFLKQRDKNNLPLIELSRIRSLKMRHLLGRAGGGDHNLTTTIYAMSREGKLIYSNEPNITALNLVTRPLVQKFIKAPLTSGNLDYADQLGKSYYGFFQEVPRSNVVFFAETPKSVVMDQVHGTIAKFGLVSLIILLFALLLLQIPLASLTKPLRRLLFQIKSVAEGDFHLAESNIRSEAGFGEMQLLNASFVAMAKDLAVREQKILALGKVEQEKIRLSHELGVAQNIQNNFLPQLNKLSLPSLEVASRYIPASEVAGDWWGLHHDEERGETIIAIADVMGHGAGSAMFTAVIASIFDEYRHELRESFHLREFADKLNGVLFRLGHQEWDASMILVKFQSSNNSLDLLAAGHPSPVLIPNSETTLPIRDHLGKKITSKGRWNVAGFMLSGELLGMSDTAHFDECTLHFPSGSSLILYSDGLTEIKNEKNKMFGKPALYKSLAQLSGAPCEQIAESLLNEWHQYKGSSDAEDDVCMIVLSAV